MQQYIPRAQKKMIFNGTHDWQKSLTRLSCRKNRLLLPRTMG